MPRILGGARGANPLGAVRLCARGARFARDGCVGLFLGARRRRRRVGAALLAARAALRAGRTALLAGRTALLSGRATLLAGRTALLAGRTALLVHAGNVDHRVEHHLLEHECGRCTAIVARGERLGAAGGERREAELGPRLVGAGRDHLGEKARLRVRIVERDGRQLEHHAAAHLGLVVRVVGAEEGGDVVHAYVHVLDARQPVEQRAPRRRRRRRRHAPAHLAVVLLSGARLAQPIRNKRKRLKNPRLPDVHLHLCHVRIGLEARLVSVQEGEQRGGLQADGHAGVHGGLGERHAQHVKVGDLVLDVADHVAGRRVAQVHVEVLAVQLHVRLVLQRALAGARHARRERLLCAHGQHAALGVHGLGREVCPREARDQHRVWRLGLCRAERVCVHVHHVRERTGVDHDAEPRELHDGRPRARRRRGARRAGCLDSVQLPDERTEVLQVRGAVHGAERERDGGRVLVRVLREVHARAVRGGLLRRVKDAKGRVGGARPEGGVDHAEQERVGRGAGVPARVVAHLGACAGGACMEDAPRLAEQRDAVAPRGAVPDDAAGAEPVLVHAVHAGAAVEAEVHLAHARAELCAGRLGGVGQRVLHAERGQREGGAGDATQHVGARRVPLGERALAQRALVHGGGRRGVRRGGRLLERQPALHPGEQAQRRAGVHPGLGELHAEPHGLPRAPAADGGAHLEAAQVLGEQDGRRAPRDAVPLAEPERAEPAHVQLHAGVPRGEGHRDAQHLAHRPRVGRGRLDALCDVLAEPVRGRGQPGRVAAPLVREHRRGAQRHVLHRHSEAHLGHGHLHVADLDVHERGEHREREAPELDAEARKHAGDGRERRRQARREVRERRECGEQGGARRRGRRGRPGGRGRLGRRIRRRGARCGGRQRGGRQRGRLGRRGAAALGHELLEVFLLVLHVAALRGELVGRGGLGGRARMRAVSALRRDTHVHALDAHGEPARATHGLPVGAQVHEPRQAERDVHALAAHNVLCAVRGEPCDLVDAVQQAREPDAQAPLEQRAGQQRKQHMVEHQHPQRQEEQQQQPAPGAGIPGVLRRIAHAVCGRLAGMHRCVRHSLQRSGKSL